ncbi:multidrug resistance efflux transporter family protein [Paenibacillus sp. UNC499MF]|uniref:DMT family transporter n=1 Tax=Paenibacillus sp. UNC499MF TaxID=1502751 RepID=UPI0008A043DE|nr:multidrug resistance efflux transporter family protein [Paenibacillus sp. UNC499MF]SEG51916.1 Putative multidrug resistance efflux transporter [Paenibacillus sp. UNC499MF]
MKPILLGILSAFFFAITFVLNRKMELGGGSWLWSGSLRYLFMVPFLLLIVAGRRNLQPLFRIMRLHPWKWLLWSTVGFGLFYAPMCFAAAYSPGWLTAGTWQLTIISGSLLAPLFWETAATPTGPVKVRSRIPLRGLAMSLVILAGIFLLQLEQAGSLTAKDLLLGVLPIVVASFAYPLGNRKMMELCGGELDVFQRVLGMTLASLPFWLLLAGWAYASAGLPSTEQTFQSLIVALSSGVIATILFFRATDMVREDVSKLAAVEATQSGEVLFALAGEVLLLSADLPSALSWLGIGIIVAGMVLHSHVSHQRPAARSQAELSMEK